MTRKSPATASLSHKQIKLAILAELQKQTTLLEVLAKQGELMRECVSGAGDSLEVTPPAEYDPLTGTVGFPPPKDLATA